MLSTEHSQVFLHAWTGNLEKGMGFVEERYSSAVVTRLDHRQLRESGWLGQLRKLTGLKGRAVVFYFRSLDDVKDPAIFLALHMLHGCRESVLADEAGQVQVITTRECMRRLPGLILAGAADAMTFAGTWLIFKWMRARAGRREHLAVKNGAPEIAYIYPYPLNRDFAGGATTHFLGFLQGVVENGATCTVFSGCRFPFDLPFPLEEIPVRRKRYIFWESLILSYNRLFAREAVRRLGGRKPGMVYQRHGRFVISGVLMARALRVPLVLEYNGSEVWMARHWDPVRFLPWLKLTEEIAIHSATLIVTVSDALKQELEAMGVPKKRILVNPNGVDPMKFSPEPKLRDEFRDRLGFLREHIVVAFAGSFSYWHGIEVLKTAIQRLSAQSEVLQGFGAARDKLRFLLIGKGPLHVEMRTALHEFEADGFVTFTGSVPHEDMPGYLNAADILVSPHVPMPDGRPFIGSPTKLFEYMAIGKAIVASRLDQLEMVLEHQRTALMVEPGYPNELANAILIAAGDDQLRQQLGASARDAALANYTWKRNTADTLVAAGLRPVSTQDSTQLLHQAN